MLLSRYLIEPCGSGKSKLTYMCRADLRYVMMLSFSDVVSEGPKKDPDFLSDTKNGLNEYTLLHLGCSMKSRAYKVTTSCFLVFWVPFTNFHPLENVVLKQCGYDGSAMN